MVVPELMSDTRAALLRRGTLTTAKYCWAGCAFCQLAVPLPKVPTHRAPAGLPRSALDHSAADWAGVDEVHVRGGLSVKEPFDYWVQFVRDVRSRTAARLSVFSPVEIFQFHTVERRSVRDLLRLLIWAGADALGPGGSESFDPAIREHWAPYRLTADEWVRVATAATAVDLPVSVAPIVSARHHIVDWPAYFSPLADVALERVLLKPLRTAQTRLSAYGETSILGIAQAVRAISEVFPKVPVAVHYAGTHLDDARLILGSFGAYSVLVDQWEVQP